MSKFFDAIKNKADKVKDNFLDKLGLLRGDWPQVVAQPPFGKPGFLPPQLISPTLKMKKSKADKADDEVDSEETPTQKKEGEYTYTDWLGYKITENPEYKLAKNLKTKDRFNLSPNLPKDKETLETEPYSMRDTLILYNDSTQDYFKYGLQTINNLNNDFPETQPLKRGEGSTSRLYNFMNNVKTTPYENNDPVMFGFEIIIDAVSSPLLNGSIYDFIDQFKGANSEIRSREEVYEDFKNQFKKLFKTRGTVRVDETLTQMTNLGNNAATVDAKQNFYNPGRRAYMAYFLKKIEGLSNLAEKNTPGTKKFITDYGKDLIKLEFYEDVSLSLGTLAHLYKLLYWSKPNGKGVIPENLLRFNCEIIVSECRNFNRTRKAVETGNLEIIKDNVSRYIYSLRECQFYFDTMTHPDTVDNSSPVVTESYTVQFDYKYSTTKFERWTPGANNFGKYVSYNNGAIWRVGTGGRGAATYSVPVPRFLSVGANSIFQNGVTKPMVLRNDFKITGKVDDIPDVQNPELPQDTLAEKAGQALKNFAKRTTDKAKNLAIQAGNRLVATAVKEAQSFLNTKVALLNSSINKILSANGIDGLNPPRNIYTGQNLDLRGRLFYDVRGEMLNFVGGLLGNQVVSAGAGVGGTIVVPPKPPKYNPFTQDNRTAQQLYGTSDFMKIQFPHYAQRYPPPLSQ